MARPKNCRKIAALPGCFLFKPAGVPARSLPEVTLTVDEFEAIRLADHEGLYQEQAAQRMGVSRQTFGRIVEAARKKVANVLVEGIGLRIEGGEIRMAEMRVFQCSGCKHVWEEPYGTGRPAACPSCKGESFGRVDESAEQISQDAGRGRHGHSGRGAGRGRGAERGKGAGRVMGTPPTGKQANVVREESNE